MDSRKGSDIGDLSWKDILASKSVGHDGAVLIQDVD